MENASRKYSHKDVKKLIEKVQEEKGWEFVFLGANIDAVEVAGRFGVAKNRAVRYECDSAGTELNFKMMSKMVSCARASRSAKEMEVMMDADEMLAPIKEDYERRQKINFSF